ncbi:MAG: hypothetical protein ABIH52_03440 [Candidatus Aenigmatarchaeota archaeon]
MSSEIRLLEPMEVGSLRIPGWVQSLHGKAPFTQEKSESALKAINVWATETGVEVSELSRLIELIKNPGTGDWRRETLIESLRFPVAYFKAAGLRIFSPSGEWRLVSGDMYKYEIHQVEGIDLSGEYNRAFDNRIWESGIITGKIGLKGMFPNDEIDVARKYMGQDDIIKFAFSGPLTQVFWSLNEYYKDIREAVLDYAEYVIRPNIIDLIKRGVRLIQIDEPQVHQLGAKLCAEAFNVATKGLDADFYIHMCFGDYTNEIFPDILEAKNCKLFTLELSNGDTWNVTGDRPGYEFLRHFGEYNDGRKIGVGLFDIHNPKVESVELQKARLEASIKFLKDPEYVHPFPDCGGRQLDPFKSYLPKLKNMVEAANQVRQQY